MIQQRKHQVLATALGVLATAAGSHHAQDTSTMYRGLGGWDAQAFFTVGEVVGAYQPPGILDGVGAFAGPNGTIKLLVNHELNEANGYAYQLANGTLLQGARVSEFLLTKNGCDVQVQSAGLAYDVIYDRTGAVVTDPAQVNEDGNGVDGFARLCSARHVEAGQYGFVDDIFFTGEESGKPFHPHGGTEWALDVDGRAIWAVPAMGRGAWENVTPVIPGAPGSVALLLGDDSESAPLYLYVGQKDALGDNSFLDRNGLAQGKLYVWTADNGDLTPEDFNGEGSSRAGTFVEILVRDAAQAGNVGYDAFGYKDIDVLQAEADALGGFSFSRPEDLHENPADGSQVVFASTGRGGLFPSDNWGTIYVIDTDLSTVPATATLTIVHDADGLVVPDEGIRSPDNLTWASDGKIYVQEDRSTSPGSLFGGTTGIEASMWALDPVTLERERVAVVDRDVVRPIGSNDIGLGSIGNWESSGVLDVSHLFDGGPADTLLVATVQAHGIRDGAIGDNPLLDEGGQLVLMTKRNVMLRNDLAGTDPGWRTEPIHTVGDSYGGYLPVGIMDGIGAFGVAPGVANVLVSHELNEGNGYPYFLANGTQLTGARVSSFVVTRDECGGHVSTASLAYDTIYDRFGQVVTNPAQVNEDGNGIDGFARFCSAQHVEASTFGFVDDIFFAGEETSKPFHPHGGTEWALDVASREIWAVPAMGRAAWENVTPIETGDPATVGILVGDDVESAPLYLYVGQKDAVGDGSFLDRNGLAVGQVYVWAADNGDLTPEEFNGEGSTRAGTFLPIDVQDVAMAGMAGYDAQGYLDGDTLRAAADALGAFSFSRPEDVHTNPEDGTQVVFASTGRGGLFPSDNWGTIYLVDVAFAPAAITATLDVLHDADGLAVPDEGIRSPDNLTWADDGFVYVQEDRSTSPGSLFGGATGIDASVWRLNPVNGVRSRVAVVDREVVLPLGSTDVGAGDLGNWETSGILDVTDLFDTKRGETLLIATVQAHGIRDGAIGDDPLLDEGGQLVFLKKDALTHRVRCNETVTGSNVLFQVFNGTPGATYFTAVALGNAGVAPLGGFYGIDITLGELQAELVAPFLGTLDENGTKAFSFATPFPCPIGLQLDAVAIEFGTFGFVRAVSEARTENL